MNVTTKAKIKDGLVVGFLWLVWSVISDWRELNTPILAKGALISAIGGSVLFGLIFGILFRPLFGFVTRHLLANKKTREFEKDA